MLTKQHFARCILWNLRHIVDVSMLFLKIINLLCDLNWNWILFYRFIQFLKSARRWWVRLTDAFRERVKYTRKQAAAKYWTTNQSKPAQTFFLSQELDRMLTRIIAMYTAASQWSLGRYCPTLIVVAIKLFPSHHQQHIVVFVVAHFMCASFRSRTESELTCDRDD